MVKGHKGWDFCIAALTWKNGTTFQVDRQQVGTTGGAPQTVAYVGLAPTHPLTIVCSYHTHTPSLQSRGRRYIPSRGWYKFIDCGGM